MYVDAEVGDHPAEQCTTRLVELLGHQPRRHLDDMGVQPERAQRISGFQPEQAAADHHTDRRTTRGEGGLRIGADRVEVVERAVDVAARQVVAGHGRYECVGTGGQHERVVIDPLVFCGDDRLCRPVDPGYPSAEPQPNLAVARVVVAGQRETSAVPVLGVSGETDTVVCGVGLLGQHGDPPRPLGVTSAHGFDEPVADHSVPDHDDVPGSC